MSYLALSKKHPEFTYHHYAYEMKKQQLLVRFYYQLTHGPEFVHQLTFPLPDPSHLMKQDPQLIEQLVFNLGLIELFSYWKTACSPHIIIESGFLSNSQLKFWHHLLLNGMGEFFYQNKINFTTPNFIQWHISNKNKSHQALEAYKNHSERISAINLGGGKDSAVLLHFFTKKPETFINLILNPASPATLMMAQKNHAPTYCIERQFDPQLIALNQKNYLNGHVPFNASLAFINLLAGLIYDFDYAVVGNEQSANEPTLYWHDQPINHQYSKSTNFEQNFRTYCSKYLINNIEYFSLLRPFSELKIAQIFSTLIPYFNIFKSCNRHQKNNTWCHQCPKCLFVFLILSPFIDEKILSTQIFQHSLFHNLSLLPLLNQLLGLAPTKPFECVGSITESQASFYLICQKYLKNKKPLPPLLSAVKTRNLPPSPQLDKSAQKLLTKFYQPHFLPSWALTMLK